MNIFGRIMHIAKDGPLWFCLQKLFYRDQFCTRFCIRLLLKFNAIRLKSSSPQMRSNWLGVEPIIHCTQEPVERSNQTRSFWL